MITKSLRLSVFICLSIFNLCLFSEFPVKKSCLVITDIHFNPFISPQITRKLDKADIKEWKQILGQHSSGTIPAYYQETNPTLLKSLSKALKPYIKDSQFILFGGDILCHHFNDKYEKYTGVKDTSRRDSFIMKTVETFVSIISQEFPNISIYFTLGNNDSFRGDYALKDEGAFLSKSAPVFFKNWIRTPNNRTIFMKDYSKHGYYSIRTPQNPGHRIISLNTVFFSSNYQIPESTDPGLEELKWLDRELEKAKIAGEKVWILMHIPPGINVYSSQKSKTKGSKETRLMWHRKYNKNYLKLVRKYKDTIKASFTGHTHMDDFRIIYKRGKKPIDYIRISPAVSPVFGNNPAFQQLFFTTSSGELIDYSTLYLNISEKRPNWQKSYTFSEAYGKRLNLKNLSEIYRKMEPGSKELKNYILYYYVKSPSNINDVWKWYVTGIGNLTVKEFNSKLKGLKN